MHEMSRTSCSISFIQYWKVAGVFVNPKVITVYSNRPFLVQYAVFYLSPLAIRIWCYPSLISRDMSHWADFRQSRAFEIKGSL
jgi:hypothetical protein